MRVVVLGSAPDARWPRSDALVAAKLSLLYYPEAVDDTQIVSSLGYAGDQRAVLQNEELLRRLRPGQLRSVTVGVREADEAAPMIAEFRALLTVGGCAQTEVLVMDRKARRESWEAVSGLREPILRGLETYGASGVRYALHRAVRTAYKRARGHLFRATPHLIRRHAIFRPSTGVVALCRAMNHFGPSAEYVLAGVSLAWPRRYPDPERDAFRGGEDIAPVPVHINADTQILRRLAADWNLTTTSADLSETIRAPLHGA